MLKEGFAEAYCKGEIENDSSSLNRNLSFSEPSRPFLTRLKPGARLSLIVLFSLNFILDISFFVVLIVTSCNDSSIKSTIHSLD